MRRRYPEVTLTATLQRIQVWRKREWAVVERVALVKEWQAGR